MSKWILLVAVGLASAVPSRRVPRDDENLFDRGSVESRPAANGKLTGGADRQEFGSHRLPLREAVEALPENIADGNLRSDQLRYTDGRGERLPLRDAVEHREAPFLGGPDHESIWIEPLIPSTIRASQRAAEPMVVCHLDSRTYHRPEPFALLPRTIPYGSCTHLVYDGATLDTHEAVIAPRDRLRDEVKGGFKAITSLRSSNPSLRILVSITAPSSDRLGRAIADETTCGPHCERLRASIHEFLAEHDFDGALIDLEGSSEHARELKSLLRLLREPLSRRGRLLAVSLRPEDPVDPEIAALVDLLVLRAWRDVPGRRRERLALHPAPLGYVARVVGKWLERTAPEVATRIVLGVPMFGQSYTLKFDNFTDVGAPVVGPGIDGEYARLRHGRLAYYEVCEKLEEGLWLSGRDEEGPYLKRGDQWIGYEDPLSVKIKTAYARSAGLGGVSLWSLDLDDFQGICGDAWPMLTAATRALGVYPETSTGRCKRDGLFSDPTRCSGFYSCVRGQLERGDCGTGRFFDVASGRCVPAAPEVCRPGQFEQIVLQDDRQESNGLREKQRREHLDLADEPGRRVVCYVTSWALYRKGEGKFVPEHLDERLCTDVVYAFAGLNPDSLMVQSFDPWADIEHNLYQRVTSLEGPRVLLALGGWTDSSGDKYSRLVSSGAARRKFVAAVVGFLRKHNFDGLSLEWNYPKCWQSDCRKGPDTDRPNFTKLVQELRREFDKQEPALSLAVVLSGYREVIDKAYELGEISRAVDYMSAMTYDYHGAWESRTGHLAPLYGTADDSNPYYNINYTMEYLVSLGADRSKLLVGVPMYGQAYRLSDPSQAGLGDPATGPGSPGEFTRQPGMLAYYEICDRIKNQGWRTGPGPSASHKEQWVGFEDARSVAAKGKFIVQRGFGGASVWTSDLDDFLNRCCTEPFPLLRSLNRALGRLLTPAGENNCRRPAEPVTPQPPTLTTHSDAVEDGNHHHHHPTTPMGTTTTRKPTTWPTWTERPSTTRRPEPTTMSTGFWTWTQRPEQTATTASWTMTRPTRPQTTTDSSTSPSGAPCISGEYVSDPSNCGQYFRCVLGELRRQQCAPGLHWDARRKLCDWPSIAKCQEQAASFGTSKPSWTTPKKTTTAFTRPTPVYASTTFTSLFPTRYTTTTTTTTTSRPVVLATNPTPKPGKPCEHGQYYAFPDSCTSFLVCVNGNLISQQCGPGLNWNQEKNMCDWAFKSPCVEKPKKNAPLLAKDEETGKCVPGSYTSVPGDCESYRACLWGRHEVFRCAPGLHFNKQTRICDWPSRANCEEGVGAEPVTRPTTSARPTRVTTQRPSWTEPTTRPSWAEPTTRPATQRPSWTEPTTRPTTQGPWTEPTKPLPPPEIDPNKESPLSGHFKVVCYFTNWAWYRRGVGRYLPEHIDHTLCTHIVYGFAVLDYSELTIKAHDSWADYDNRFYERVVAYKNRGLKVLLALGGWNDSAGDKYSRLVNNPSSRKRFIDHAVKFIEKHGFDGLDLDWEYPVCWQVDCTKGPASDRAGFAALLRELNAELKPRGLLMSAAVSPSKKVIDRGYDVPALAKYLDWIAVMTYDFHGQWDKKTGHVAPLFYHPEDEFYYFNANYSINYWISKGAPPRSIVMGMPLYGQSFSVHDPKAGTGLNAPASAGNAGEFTKAAGFLAYYEICDRVNNRGWTVVQDPQRRMGPYAYKGSQWVSFDDSDMIRQKAQFVRDMGLGGGMVWALDLDDFKGRCGDGPHPLLHTLQQVLAEPPNSHDRPIRPPQVGEDIEWELPAAPPATTVSPTTISTQSTAKADTDDEFKVVCYFTNWAWYRQEGGRFLPEDIDPDLCTHVVYGFAVLDTTSLTIKSHDPWADIDNKFYDRVVAFKKKGLKVLLAIGGWNDSAGDKYSRLVNSPQARRRFIAQVMQFIEKYGFEGLDLDWEYPVCWQVDCNKGPKSDKESFSALVRELSAEFKPKGLLLSAAVSPSKRVIDTGYDVPNLAKYLDWIAVMAYDYHGQWDKKTGHVAPLYALPNDWEPTFNANFSIHYWIEKGAPAKKLVMGAPLYGQSFSLAQRSETGLNAPTYGGGEAGEATRARGFLSYYEICERTLQKGWTVVQDSRRRIGPYAYKGDQWVSFDDARQTKLKAEFIRDMGLGGGMVWALDLDDFKNRCGCEPSPLLRTMNRVLRNYPDGPLCPVTPGTSTTVISAPTTEVAAEWPTSSSTSNYEPPELTDPENEGDEDDDDEEEDADSDEDIDDTVEIDAGPPPGVVTPVGDCGGRVFIPHKTDCSKYYLCNFGKLSEHSCAPGLHWNENRCDWPENAKCKKRTGPTR